MVGHKFEDLSAIIVSYASENYLALNEAKTQVLWCQTQGSAIKVGSSVVTPAEKFKVLGVSFNKFLFPLPYLNSLISPTRALTVIIRRLLLPSEVLNLVIGSFFRGKIGYASLILKPRLNDSDATSTIMAQFQVRIYDLARATIGTKKSDRLRVEDLLSEAGLESLNRMIIYSIVMECWCALSPRDMPNGPLNPLGSILSTPINSSMATSSRTRSANKCCFPPTKFRMDMFTW